MFEATAKISWLILGSTGIMRLLAGGLMDLQPTETELIGAWVQEDNSVHAAPGCERIETLTLSTENSSMKKLKGLQI